MKGKKVEYNGKPYSSIKALCNEFDISYAMVSQRLKIGMSLKDAVEIPKKSHKNGKSVEYKGKKYPSLRSLARLKGMPYHVAQMRVKKGLDIETAIDTPVGELMGNEIEFKGKEYPSFTKLCEKYEVPTSIDLSRMKSMNWSLEKTLTTPVRKTKNKYIPTLIYEGKKYTSLKALCNECGKDYQNALNRLHRGKTLEEALDTPIRPRKKNNKTK